MIKSNREILRAAICSTWSNVPEVMQLRSARATWTNVPETYALLRMTSNHVLSSDARSTMVSLCCLHVLSLSVHCKLIILLAVLLVSHQCVCSSCSLRWETFVPCWIVSSYRGWLLKLWVDSFWLGDMLPWQLTYCRKDYRSECIDEDSSDCTNWSVTINFNLLCT